MNLFNTHGSIFYFIFENKVMLYGFCRTQPHVYSRENVHWQTAS